MTSREGEDALSPGLVLIVEDEAPIAETLAEIVADAGYTAVVAGHGREALELACIHRPSLVITDLMMPYLDGAGLIAALRARAADDGISPAPVILMTAAGRQFTEGAAADAVLPKPFDLAQVEHLLKRFLGGPAAESVSGSR